MLKNKVGVPPTIRAKALVDIIFMFLVSGLRTLTSQALFMKIIFQNAKV